MPVRSLTLDGFRSYEHLEIRLGGGPHVVVGRNAAGQPDHAWFSTNALPVKADLLSRIVWQGRVGAH